jgi:sulfate adenylyltransferase subunit 2
MSTTPAQNLSPPKNLANWLLAEMIAEISAGSESPWDIQRLMAQGSRSISSTKSKRSWERQIQNIHFLACTTRLDRIKSGQGAPANQVVLEHIVQQARSQRTPIFFAELHQLTELAIAVVATTKGHKQWLALKLEATDSDRLINAFLSLIESEGAILIPQGDLVQLLVNRREEESRLGSDHQTSLQNQPQIDWKSALLAFSSTKDQPSSFPSNNKTDISGTSNLPINSQPRAETKAQEQNGMRKAEKTNDHHAQLSHLQRLEAESIHIIREVMAHADNPVMLYSIGKDSSVMLHLARKAFYPSAPPFPLLHVDTRWKFREMYDFRAKMAEESGMQLLVHINPEGVKKNINPFDHGSALHTDIMKTEGLKQALDLHKFDVAFGGARRDEEKSRAKERIFSFRNQAHRWDPKNQRPELWNLYNCRKHPGESVRVFPLSNWTELDIWQYIYQENIPIVPLYFAAERPVVARDGMLIMVDDDRMKLLPGEKIEPRTVRFRTLGCYPLTGAIESSAKDLADIVLELLQSTTSERQGRAIDSDSSASMEKKKQEGYF